MFLKKLNFFPSLLWYYINVRRVVTKNKKGKIFMKKKLNEEKQIQAKDIKDTNKNTMSEEEFDVYIEKIMSNDEAATPEAKKENKEKEVKEEKSELGELKEDLKRIINSLSAISNNMAYIPANKQTAANEPKDIQRAKMLGAILAERKRQDAMRKHIFAQAEDLKKTFSDFDLRALYNSSPEFKAELDRTRSVYGAYLKYIASKLGNIPATKPRFIENGAMPGLTSGSVNASPAGLPDKEFDEYIHQILGDL